MSIYLPVDMQMQFNAVDYVSVARRFMLCIHVDSSAIDATQSLQTCAQQIETILHDHKCRIHEHIDGYITAARIHGIAKMKCVVEIEKHRRILYIVWCPR